MSHLVLFVVACLGLAGCVSYLALVAMAAIRFRRRRASVYARDAAASSPPVTLLKPLHGMEPGLRENLESFFLQDYPSFEIVFGARSNEDPALDVVRELAGRYPQVQVRTVLSGTPEWPNAKVYNLEKMSAAVSHEILVISDSDVRVTPGYVRAVTRPLLDPKVGLVTCLYRGVPTGGIWSRLEAIAMSVEMTAGVIVAEMLEGMKFALGPTMATRRDCLNKIGGFPGLANYLADDYILGNRIHDAGYRVVLSEYVIGHLAINQSCFKSLQHQFRWAKSTRRSRPKGHIGTGLTFATPFAMLSLYVALTTTGALRGPAVALFAAGILISLLQCLIAGGIVVRDPAAWRMFWLYPARDLLGFVFWVCSFVAGNRTIWRGESYRLQAGGLITRES